MTESDSLHFEVREVGLHNKRTHLIFEGQAGQIRYRNAGSGITRGPIPLSNDYGDYDYGEPPTEALSYCHQEDWKVYPDSARVWTDLCAFLEAADAWNLWHGRDLTTGYAQTWSLRVTQGERRLECYGSGDGPPGFRSLLGYLKNHGSAEKQLECCRRECAGLLPGDAPEELLRLVQPVERADLYRWDLAGRLRSAWLPQFYADCLEVEVAKQRGRNCCTIQGAVLLAMLDQWPEELEAPLPPAELFPQATLGHNLTYALVKLLLRISGSQEVLWQAFLENRGCRWLGPLVPIDDPWRQRILSWLDNLEEIGGDQFDCLRDWLLRDPLLARQVLKMTPSCVQIHCCRPGLPLEGGCNTEPASPGEAMDLLLKCLDSPFSLDAAQRLLDWLDHPDCREVIFRRAQEILERGSENSEGARLLAANPPALPPGPTVSWAPIQVPIPGPSSAAALEQLRRLARQTRAASSVGQRLAGLQVLITSLEQAEIDPLHRPDIRRCLERAQRQVVDGGPTGTADLMGPEFYDFYRWLDLLSLNLATPSLPPEL